MSTPDAKDELVQAVQREMRLMSFYDALFSQACAERVNMHSTDIETMDLLNTLGPLTAGELSEHTGLTSGATTRLIDRLERAGYVRRRSDQQDRRRVIIEPIWENLGEIGVLYEPLAEGLSELWSAYSEHDLAVILDFARKSNAFVLEQNARVRGLPAVD
jgi:DNA-binding MarR family transcriptional regulator